jgi:anti-sigma factor RsiW
MSHENFEHKLLQYFYQELSKEEREEFDTHLSECAVCRNKLAGLEALALELDSVFAGAEPGRETLEKIERAARSAGIEAGSRRAGTSFAARPRLALTFAAAAAFVAALFTSLWLVFFKPSPTDYGLAQVAMAIDSLEQDMAMVAGRGEEAYFANELSQLDPRIDDSSSESDAGSLVMDSLESELEEIEGISNGIL